MSLLANGDVTISGNLGTRGRSATPTSSGWAGGINTWDIEVAGSLFAQNAYKPGGGSWSSSSDIKLKKNVEPLENALGRLLQLHGVTFEWKDPEQQGNLSGTQIGLVAQDVEQAFPAWVGSFPDGTKHVTFRGFEALTVEAFRELNTIVDNMRQRLETLEQRMRGVAAVSPIAEEAVVEAQSAEKDESATAKKSVAKKSKKTDPEQVG